jgi:hypothetical protein
MGKGQFQMKYSVGVIHYSTFYNEVMMMMWSSSSFVINWGW